MREKQTRREVLVGVASAAAATALPVNTLGDALAQQTPDATSWRVLCYYPTPERMLERLNHIADTTTPEEREAWRVEMRRQMGEYLAKLEARV